MRTNLRKKMDWMKIGEHFDLTRKKTIQELSLKLAS